MAALTTDQILSVYKSFNVRGKWEVLVDLEKIVYGSMKTYPPIEAIRSTEATGNLTVEEFMDAMNNIIQVEKVELARAIRNAYSIT